MLRTLHVRNFGVLGDVEVDFEDGLSVLTGETGAGKSLLVGAIKLLLGARADSSDVRTGESQALVEAVFDFSEGSCVDLALAESGHRDNEPEPGDEARANARPCLRTVHVKRVVTADGKSRAYINGSLASARELREIIGNLVSVAGQHAFIGLGIPAERLAMLDAFCECGELRDEVAVAFDLWDSARRRREKILAERTGRESRRDYLRHVISQIEASGVTPGETQRVAAEAAVLRGAGRLRELALLGYDLLYEGGGAVHDQMGVVEQSFREMCSIDSSLGQMLARFDSARIEVREIARELLDYGESVDLDPERLSQVESRLEALQDLARKYGGSDDAVIRTLEESRAELQDLDSQAGEQDDLEARVASLFEAYRAAAARLTETRRIGAVGLGSRVTSVIRGLAMDGATFMVDVSECEPSRLGSDRVDFNIETNSGEGYGPVADVASGGELSRITLGLYSVMSASVGTPVMIYDEIDAGVSGGVAQQMGKVLKEASVGRQVLVVTHHGQVAACGDLHLKVYKETSDGRTVAGVERLDEKGRLDEIARIIGGVVVTDKAREHAGEMLGARDDGLLL